MIRVITSTLESQFFIISAGKLVYQKTLIFMAPLLYYTIKLKYTIMQIKVTSLSLTSFLLICNHSFKIPSGNVLISSNGRPIDGQDLVRDFVII